MLEKDAFACLDVINYSMVAIKDDSWILEMVNSGNKMLHEQMRNANSYAWAWISWAWIPCYLSIDYPNYGFSCLLITMPPSGSWGCFSHSCLQGWIFLIALVFLTSFVKALFICSLCLHLKKEFLICPKVCICSLEISCLSRIEDKKWTGGHLAGRHQRIQRKVTEFTPAHSDLLSETICSVPVAVWLPGPAVSCAHLLGWG